ncbi:MAG: hypothetical protein HY774_18965 [Acidobacteria bacterium]|nr:hypothetical protein [Acidobacteriota bacterium]
MGSFGSGIFDNDSALDVRRDVLDYILAAIKEFIEGDDFGVEDVDSTMGYIAMLTAVLETSQCSEIKPGDPRLLVFLKSMGQGGGPTTHEVTRWKKTILQVYDDEIDELRPDPDYKVEYRANIVAAFSKLEQQV